MAQEFPLYGLKFVMTTLERCIDTLFEWDYDRLPLVLLIVMEEVTKRSELHAMTLIAAFSSDGSTRGKPHSDDPYRIR